MTPLVSRIRPGRSDLLWADGVTHGEDGGPDAFSLRGSGRGTVVLLDRGLTEDQWRRIALGLSNDLEVLRIGGSGDATRNAVAITAGLRAISSKHWALLAVGASLPDAEALETAPSQPTSTRQISSASNAVLSDGDVERVCGSIIQIAVTNSWVTATEAHPDQGCVRAARQP
jgi:hypothetical protein